MGRKENTELRNSIFEAIQGAGRKVTSEDISRITLGIYDEKSRKCIQYYLNGFLNSGQIIRHGVRKCPRDAPYLYSIKTQGIDISVCSVCHKPVLSLQDDMCPVCFDTMNQTAPSIPESQNHLAKGTKVIGKITRAFQPGVLNPAILNNTQKVIAPIPIKTNTAEVYSNGKGRVDVLQKYLDTQVKVQIKNSNTVLFGNVLRIEGGCIGLQTTRGPLDIDIDAIAVIGQWDQTRN